MKTVGLFDFGFEFNENDKIDINNPNTQKLLVLILKKHTLKRSEKERNILK